MARPFPVKAEGGESALGTPRTASGTDVVHAGYAAFRPPAPAPLSPELAKPVFRDGKLDPGYFLVHFRGPIRALDEDWLDERTGPVRRADGSELARWYVPDHALAVWIDDAAEWLALRRSERVDWVGRYEPGYKLAPALADEPLDEPLRLNLDLVPGHPPGPVVQELETLGVRVLEVVHHRGRGSFDLHFLSVEASPRLLTRVAWIEGIRLVQRRGVVEPLADTGIPSELDAGWVAELAGRARAGRALVGRLAGEPALDGYDQVSALLDLLAHDHPLVGVELCSSGLVALPESPVKNALTLEPGQALDATRARNALFLAGRQPGLAPSSALRKALWLDGERDLPASERPARRHGGSERDRIAHDVPAADGFRAVDAAPAVHVFRCTSAASPLRLTLAWTDEPAPAGPGKKLVNDLDLVVTAPDGTVYRGNGFGPSGESVPGARSDEWLEAESLLRAIPEPGLWTAAVRPSRGRFAGAQGYALVVSGDVREGPGTLAALLAPTTLTLRVVGAVNSKNGPLGSADLERLRTSDDNRYGLRDREELRLAFDRTLPANASVSAFRVLVEHHDEPRIVAGEVQWRLALGTSILATTSAPLRSGPGQETLDAWAPSPLPASANGLELIVQNNSQGDDTLLDRVFVEVDYVLPTSGPRILSTPNPIAVVGLAYDYDADRRAETNGAEGVTWSVVSAPTGFSIHPTTGLVTWTPSAPGSFAIVIRAENASWGESQSFAVTVSSAVPLPSTVLPANALPLSYCPSERLALGPAKATQRLNVFLPSGSPPPSGWPVILNNRAGGGIATGPFASIGRTGNAAPLHAFLSAGMAVVDFGVMGISNGQGLFYPPGHPSGRYESFRPTDDSPVKDAEWAIQWLKTQSLYALDAQRVCVRGASHGAIVSMWASMGPERARTTGSTQVRTSTRVKAVLALQPPVSFWAYDQTPALASRVIAQFEQQAFPGLPATALGQVAEELQKAASIMGFAFATPAARARNEEQPICLLFAEPVKMSGSAPASLALDASGFPTLHATLGQPFIHDSWAGYVLYRRLLDLSAGAALFHGTSSIFAVRDTSALATPFAHHTRTFSGNVFGSQALALAHDWVLRTL